MRAWLPIARLSRSALAVAALYAFVLGSYLGLLPPDPLAAAAHVLCSPSGDGSSRPSAPEGNHRECCTPACPGGAPLPPPPSAALVPPERLAAAPEWIASPDPARAGTALRDTRARGPPLA